MIKKGSTNIGEIYKGTTEISKILKGTLLVYESWKTLTSQGIPPLTLLNCKGGNLLDYKIYGNSVQNGTPMPSNPIEIQSVGDKTKNLLNNQDSFNKGEFRGVVLSYDKETQEFTLNGTSTGAIDFELYKGDLDIESGEVITISAIHTSGTSELTSNNLTFAYGLFSQDSSKFIRGKTNLSTMPEVYSFTATMFENSGGSNKRLLLQLWAVGTVFSNYKFKVQIEKNNSVTSYEPYGYKIPVTVSGKNLINVKDSPFNNSNYNPSDVVPVDYNKVYWMAASGYIRTNKPDDITVSGDEISFTTTGAWYGIGYPIKVKPNTKYTISGIRYEGTNTKFEYAFYDNTGVFKSFAQITTNNNVLDMSATITIPADVDTIFVIVAGTVNGSLVKMSKIQIEEGQNRTPYELYHAPIKTNIYLDKPLMGLGDYADYIDFGNQRIYRKIKKGIIDNNSTFGKFSAVTDYSAFYMAQNDLVDYYPDIAINQPMLSPQLVYYPAGGGNTNTLWTGVYQISTSITSTYKRIIFSLPNTIIDVASAKAWLQTNPVEYYYPVQTPAEESITLPDIPSIKGTTIYSIDTNIQPSNMYVKYKGK